MIYALAYKIESWDGYILYLAKIYGAPAIYSVDKELARKVKEVAVVNPIHPEIFEKYTKWLEERLKKQ